MGSTSRVAYCVDIDKSVIIGDVKFQIFVWFISLLYRGPTWATRELSLFAIFKAYFKSLTTMCTRVAYCVDLDKSVIVGNMKYSIMHQYSTNKMRQTQECF